MTYWWHHSHVIYLDIFHLHNFVNIEIMFVLNIEHTWQPITHLQTTSFLNYIVESNLLYVRNIICKSNNQQFLELFSRIYFIVCNSIFIDNYCLKDTKHREPSQYPATDLSFSSIWNYWKHNPIHGVQTPVLPKSVCYFWFMMKILLDYF